MVRRLFLKIVLTYGYPICGKVNNFIFILPGAGKQNKRNITGRRTLYWLLPLPFGKINRRVEWVTIEATKDLKASKAA